MDRRCIGFSGLGSLGEHRLDRHRTPKRIRLWPLPREGVEGEGQSRSIARQIWPRSTEFAPSFTDVDPHSIDVGPRSARVRAELGRRWPKSAQKWPATQEIRMALVSRSRMRAGQTSALRRRNSARAPASGAEFAAQPILGGPEPWSGQTRPDRLGTPKSGVAATKRAGGTNSRRASSGERPSPARTPANWAPLYEAPQGGHPLPRHHRLIGSCSAPRRPPRCTRPAPRRAPPRTRAPGRRGRHKPRRSPWSTEPGPTWAPTMAARRHLGNHPWDLSGGGRLSELCTRKSTGESPGSGAK